MKLNRQDLGVGAIFLGFGLFFALYTLIDMGDAIGTPARMGPGFFPIGLAAILILLGLVIMVRSVNAGEMAAAAFAMPWRGLLVLLPMPVFFGLVVRDLGLFFSVFVVAFVSSFASRKASILWALPLALGLSVFCLAVFRYGLRLNIPVFGPWLGPAQAWLR